jgi:hypothetical protein
MEEMGRNEVIQMKVRRGKNGAEEELTLNPLQRRR